MHKIFNDIETVPAQDPAVRQAISDSIEPPGNMSKAETIAAWKAEKKPDLIDKAWRATSFDGALGMVVAIGVALDDEKPIVFSSADPLSLKEEAGILRGFADYLNKAMPKVEQRQGLQWIGHYVADFDLPFLYKRYVIHGIKPPAFIPFGRQAWSDGIYDTMTEWAGRKGRVSLDKLCRVLGIDAKGSEIGDEIDGSKVWDFVQAGRIAEVAQYCGGDVERVREVYRRMTFS